MKKYLSRCSILLLIFVLFGLTACGKVAERENTREENNDSAKEDYEITENKITEDSKERLANLANYEFDSSWYVNTWYRGSENTNNFLWIDDRFEYERGEITVNGAGSVICPFDKNGYELKEDDYGIYAHYSYEWTNAKNEPEIVTIDYYPESKMLLLYMTGSPYTGRKYNYSDLYFYDKELTSIHAPSIQEFKDERNNNQQTYSDEELDVPDQEQIEYEGNGAFSEQQVISYLPGVYESSEGDELEIIDNGDGNYTINFSIYRLATFENCGGVYQNYMINFNAVVPSEDIVNGNIEIADSKNRVRLTITDSRWDMLETWTQIEFDRK